MGALRALRFTESVGIHFADDKGRLERLTCGELIRQAEIVAGSLLTKKIQPGEPVILVMTNPRSAITAIVGCMIAGCPPTPVYPPVTLSSVPIFLRFIDHVAARSRAAFIIADQQPYSLVAGLPGKVSSIRGAERFSSLISGSGSKSVSIEVPAEDTLAFLQFTSGSTSMPKGVMVMHSGLYKNLEMIRESSRMSTKSTVVTWLPVYHDMGLIGTVLNAITLPCELIVLPPLVFLKRPRLWLELITRFRGTHTAAPNFAYGLCVKRVPDVSGIDLSSMTTFICGAEPVIPKTMEDFIQHYQPARLNPGAMVPAYGLAEATLAVTFSPFMRGLRTDEVDLNSLSSGRKATLKQDGNIPGVRIVSCGVPLNGMQVRIAGEDQLLGERHVGEIQIQGPCVTPGYIGDEEATRNSRTLDGWLKTGDLGYIADGELFSCGRIKDIIIIRGKNFHAHDIESVVSEVPGIRTGNVVAFSVMDGSAERLVVVAETRTERKSKDLEREVRAHLAESTGITPDEVVIVPAATLPKTSSGKLKRNETRQLYLEGKLLDKPGIMDGLQTLLKTRLPFFRK